jgi:hypothetical protein
MARPQKSRRRRSPIRAAGPVGLYDYACRLTRRRGRSAKVEPTEWVVTDDWPEQVPVTEAEIEVFEAWFGDLFDELFSTRN